MQDNEDDELEIGTTEISQLLGDKENLYQKILYLVIADSAYSEGKLIDWLIDSLIDCLIGNEKESRAGLSFFLISGGVRNVFLIFYVKYLQY